MSCILDVKKKREKTQNVCSSLLHVNGGVLNSVCLMGKPTMWFSNRSDTNRPVQSPKMARDWKFWI